MGLACVVWVLVFFDFRHCFGPTTQETKQGKSWSTKAAGNIMNASAHFLMQCIIPKSSSPRTSHS